MGIADRDYTRPGGPSGGGFGGPGGTGNPFGGIPHPRSWSFNAWLIVINVAVFVLGAVMAASGGTSQYVFETQRYYTEQAKLEGLRGRVDADQPVARMRVPVESDEIREVLGRPIINPETDEFIGIQSYRPTPSPIHALGHFSTGKGFLGYEVWRLITFQFLHAGILHLALNMVALFFFGPMVERYLRSKMLYAAFYFTCGIAGALLYLVLNLIGNLGLPLPFALDVDLYTPLIGASAGVFGVLMAAAFIAPQSKMLVFGILPIKLRTGAYLFVAIAFLGLITQSNNAGGEAAHLGGAAAGFYFIRNPKYLLDFFDGIISSRGSKKGKPARVVADGKKATRASRDPDPGSPKDVERMDHLLAKVANQGMHSLTRSERAFLDKMSKKMKKRS